MKKVIVSLSGGVDSTVLLAQAIQQGYECLPVIFRYGSKHNFSSELLNRINPQLCFASHGFKKRYGHPHREVVNLIRVRGITFLGVTEKPRTKIIEHVYAR